MDCFLLLILTLKICLHKEQWSIARILILLPTLIATSTLQFHIDPSQSSPMQFHIDPSQSSPMQEENSTKPQISTETQTSIISDHLLNTDSTLIPPIDLVNASSSPVPRRNIEIIPLNVTEIKRRHHNVVIIGDMLMDEEEYAERFSNHTGRKGVISAEKMWPKENGYPTVPYAFELENKRVEKIVEDAMMFWEANTCLRFRDQKENEFTYLRFISDEGCYSFIGRTRTVGQPVSLGNGCHYVSTAVHELGHAIGFLHEQMRPDRDSYININFRNIEDEEKDNFLKRDTDEFSSYGAPYDFTSIMQYPSTAFTKTGGVTLRAIDPKYQGLMGRHGYGLMSHRDKLVANKMYGCIEMWQMSCRGKKKEVCLNDGYTGPNCTCVCPPGTEGKQCGTVVGDYYDDVLPSCNMIINETKTIIQTPNYPKYIPANTWCVYQIKAPKDHMTEVIFKNFHLESNGNDEKRCSFASLTFLQNYTTTIDKVVCGDDLPPGYKYPTYSTELTMFLDISIVSFRSRGFVAEVLFLKKKDTIRSVSPAASQLFSAVPHLVLFLLALVLQHQY